MSRSFGLTEKEMVKGIKIRKIRAEDVPEIVSVQESILQKKVSKKWIQSVEYHLKKQEGVGFVASKDGQVVGFIIGEMKGWGFGLEKSGRHDEERKINVHGNATVKKGSKNPRKRQ